MRRDWENIEVGHETDDQRLRDFGYRPQFQRVLSLFGDFSLGYSYMSPIAGFYALFAFALATGGPSFFWTMPIVLLGMLFVTLVFAEASSQYPIAGGVYQWARRIGGPRWGFMTGWMYLLALLGTNAGLCAGVSAFIAALLGIEATPVFNAVAAMALLVVAMIVNLSGTKILAKATELGVWTGLIGFVVFGLYMLLFARVQPFSALNQAFESGLGANFTSLAAASLIGIWIFFGFEACGDLAEEVTDASRKVPKAMLLTTIAGGISTLVIALGMILAVHDFAAVANGTDTNPAATTLADHLGPVGEKIMLLIVISVVFSAAVSIMASTSRLLFSLGRDGLIFGSEAMARIEGSRALPVPAVITATVIPCIILALGLYSADAVTSIISFATAGIYLSFGMVVVACLWARGQGWVPSGAFTMGGIGTIVNVLALLWLVVALVNIMWPRPASPDQALWQVYLIPISLVIILILGLLQLGKVDQMIARQQPAE